MTTFTWQDVEKLKSENRYRHAGQLAALLGYGPSYGCHFGMRSTRDMAVQEFAYGWQELHDIFRKNNG